MLSVDVATTPLPQAAAELVVIGAFAPASGERDDPPELAGGADGLAPALGVELVDELVACGFGAAVGSVARVPTRGAITASMVLVVGLGTAADADADTLRRAGAAAAGAAERVPSLASSLPSALADLDVAAGVQAVTEGLALGSYRFVSYRSEPTEHELATASLHVSEDDADAAGEAAALATVTAGAAMLARDLVNTPPQDKRPPALADRVVELLADTDVAVRVLDEAALAEGGYGGLLGVGQGSSEPPRLVELTYAPAESARHVALVGKGITFDSGGISLKPSASMETMKLDMGGAATVVATVRAAAALSLPVKLTGLLCLAENLPSGSATRVSDVLTIRGGTTVEVLNTDAEGRLVLADGLTHASELEPDAIVDVATLTGAAVVALGERIGVVMASDDDLADTLLAASGRTGEALWRLPLATAQYGERVEGTISDLKNAGSRAAGTIFAGLFLHRFVADGIPWAHLDIAGTAWSDEAYGYIAKGGTGTPVRTLLDWLRDA